MGIRLYVTGMNFDDKTNIIEEKEECFGKLYAYEDMHKMRSADFLCGFIAGRNMESAISEINEKRRNLIEVYDNSYEEDEYNFYSWEFVPGAHSNGLILNKTAMRRFTELFIEDKKEFDVWPCNDERKKELFDFVDKYQLFELIHFG